MIARIEKPFLRIGIVPLADAAPIVVAQTRGYFARHGIDVDLSVERAWTTVRDKLAAGVLDAAQLLAPMPLAATLGLDSVQMPIVSALTLNLNGNSIIVSNAMYERMLSARRGDEAGALGWARALKRVADVDRLAGRPAPVFAHVYPWSTHHYELRYWFAAGGVQPDEDMNLIVVPPPQAVAQLEAGRIDGFCVGSPWSELAEQRGLGRRVASKYQIWNNSPEKVLGVTRLWAEQHPQTHIALVAAIIEASRWLDAPANRAIAARLLADERGFEPAAESLELALRCKPADSEFGPGLVFHAGAAGFPWLSHARWYLAQMRRWHHLRSSTADADIAAAVCRPALYRSAAARVAVPAPRIDHKSEGLHAAPWVLQQADAPLTMGPDLLLDGAHFDVSEEGAHAPP